MKWKWLLASVLAVPLAVGGGLAFAASQGLSVTCPLTGKVICFRNYCPFGGCHQQDQESPSTCPVSSEEPSGDCCCPGQE